MASARCVPTSSSLLASLEHPFNDQHFMAIYLHTYCTTTFFKLLLFGIFTLPHGLLEANALAGSLFTVPLSQSWIPHQGPANSGALENHATL
jgi:hypothetical protein